ncbi:MAG: hypothetical protein LBI11_02735 [Streptococcaceae bacterium]|jgi:hypothetical protein|nr:hypothetical protein [Streptococcaceae bacterium]
MDNKGISITEGNYLKYNAVGVIIFQIITLLVMLIIVIKSWIQNGFTVKSFVFLLILVLFFIVVDSLLFWRNARIKNRTMLYYDNQVITYYPDSKKQIGPINWKDITSIELRNENTRANTFILIHWSKQLDIAAPMRNKITHQFPIMHAGDDSLENLFSYLTKKWNNARWN